MVKHQNKKVEVLQSSIITKLEKFGEYVVIGVTIFLLASTLILTFCVGLPITCLKELGYLFQRRKRNGRQNERGRFERSEYKK